MGASGPTPYPVPAKSFEAEHRADRSRFLARVEPAGTVTAAREVIADARRSRPEANHHAYAFIVGHGASEISGMSDDGEPPATAGRPIMAALRASGLGDVCLVVSRIFGGRKLGVAGLARAYGEAARLAASGVEREVKRNLVPARLTVPYSHFEAVRHILEASGAAIVASHFEAEVELELLVDRAGFASLEQLVTAASAGAGKLSRLPQAEP